MMRRDRVPDWERRRTILGATETKRGFIPHLRLQTTPPIDAPVVLVPREAGDTILCMPRINTAGHYVHAIPGGGEVEGAKSW